MGKWMEILFVKNLMKFGKKCIRQFKRNLKGHWEVHNRYLRKTSIKEIWESIGKCKENTSEFRRILKENLSKLF